MKAGIISGYLNAKTVLQDGSIQIAYEYKVPDNDIKLSTGVFTVLANDVQAMYDAVSSGLPDPDTDFNLYFETAFYKAFVNQMVLTFDATVGDIDIVS